MKKNNYFKTTLSEYNSFQVGDLVYLCNYHSHEGSVELEPWDLDTFGIILDISFITEHRFHHYELEVLAKDGRVWTVDPSEIKEIV